MMPSPELERFVTLIADNVISAIKRDRNGAPFHPTMRMTVVSELVRSLLLIMPTAFSDVPTAACNWGFDDVLGVVGIGDPRVEAVNPRDGTITIISA